MGVKTMRLAHISVRNRMARILWRVVWSCLFRPSPRYLFGWRRFLLRCFGAKLGNRTYIYPTVQVWGPWNLEMGDDSCLSHFVDCYSVDKIVIGNNATVSQNSVLCTASHDFNRKSMPLIVAPINIGSYAWITSYCFLAPGVSVAEGGVVGATSTVTRNVEPWDIVAGVPAQVIGKRDKERFFCGE